MFRHILIPTDGSEASARAIKQGMQLASALGVKVTGVHVIPSFHPFTYRSQMLLTYRRALPEDSEAAYTAATLSCAKEFLRAIKHAASAAGVPCDTVHAHEDQAYKAIVATAKKRRCDLIFMASHGRGGVAGILLGSETQKVLVHSDIPVLVCH